MLFRFWPRSVSELFNSRGLLRVLGVFLESTTGLVGTGLMTFLRAGNFWDTTGLAARFTADVLVTFLGPFACYSAAPLQDVRAKERERQRVSVRMWVSMGMCVRDPS